MASMPLPSTSGQCLCLPIGLRWPSQRHWPWDTPSSWSFAFAFAFAKAPPQGPKRWPWDISTFWRDTDPHRPRDIVTDPRRVVACKLPWPWHEPVQWCLGSTNHLEPTLSIYYGISVVLLLLLLLCSCPCNASLMQCPRLDILRYKISFI